MSTPRLCPCPTAPCKSSPTRYGNTAQRWAADGAACPPGRQALLVLAHLRKGETYTALAGGFGVGTTTVFRYVREGVDVLAAVAPTLDQALDVARRKAFVILDGTLLSIDRVGMASRLRPRRSSPASTSDTE